MYPWDDIELPDEETLNRELSRTKALIFIDNEKGVNTKAFMGSLMCSHDYIWDYDCPTAWCNGHTIGFNPRFFWSLGREERLTLLVHELLHTAYDHMGRLEGRCPDMWNEAADYVINNQLDNWGYSFKDMGGLLDHQYDNMSSEEVYELIKRDGPKPMPQPDPGDAPGDGQPNQAGQNGNPQQGPDTPILGGDLRKAQSEEDREKTKANIVRAVQVAQQSGQAGDIPGEVTEVMDKFLDPVLPWNVLLARFFEDYSVDDYSWSRPNRRHEDDYLPSLYSDNKLQHLVYFLDVSGSITNGQLMRFFSEVKYIHETYAPKRLTMITFDTELHDFFELTEDDRFEKFEITGRGGTCLSEVYDYIHKHQPTAAVVFSDLFVAPMEENPGPEIIWAVMDNPKAKVFFGKKIHIRSQDL